MRVTEIMRRPVVCVHPGTATRDATALLVENAFAALPVVDADGCLIGIVTEADLLRGTVRDTRYGLARAASGISVAELMTTPVVALPITAPVAEFRDKMLVNRMRCIPVVDEDAHVVGMVSRGDLLRTFIHQDDVTAAKVRRLLADYAGGSPEWHVHVNSGVAVVTGEFADEAEQGLVTALVRTAPGVTRVDLRPHYALAAGAAG
jgi:CBS domain-containing protein